MSLFRLEWTLDEGVTFQALTSFVTLSQISEILNRPGWQHYPSYMFRIVDSNNLTILQFTGENFWMVETLMAEVLE